MRTRIQNSRKRGGFSLLELLAVVTILGIIAVVVIPRISVSAGTAKANANSQNKSEINGAIERYYVEEGAYPTKLSDLAADYFPDGVPTNPVTEAAYTINSTTHRLD
jgi:prepilin-type N-terminal cleavage/methylation domain-containing protein